MSKVSPQTISRIKYIMLCGLALLVFSAVSSGFTATVYAADPICRPGEVPSEQKKCIIQDLTKCHTCDPSLPGCKPNTTPGCTSSVGGCSGNDCGLIAKYLNPSINFLAAILGIVATIAIVVGGIQYSSSADDPGKVAKAKSRIINALLALLAFFFLWAFLQWLIPGGFL